MIELSYQVKFFTFFLFFTGSYLKIKFKNLTDSQAWHFLFTIFLKILILNVDFSKK